MTKQIPVRIVTIGLCTVLAFALNGCTKQQAVDTVAEAEKSAGQAVEEIGQQVGDAVEAGEEMAGELSEKATAYLTPLKEKFGNLESLKETPDRLKAAVSDLIQSIEDKAEDITLPESLSNALASVKEKLIALEEYLEGEVEQAKIDEHLRDIADSVKSAFGMSDE